MSEQLAARSPAMGGAITLTRAPPRGPFLVYKCIYFILFSFLNELEVSTFVVVAGGCGFFSFFFFLPFPFLFCSQPEQICAPISAADLHPDRDRQRR